MTNLNAMLLIAALLFVNACTHDGAAPGAQSAASEQAGKFVPPTTIPPGIYPAPDEPNYGPAYGSIRFVDTDPTEMIGGILTMGLAVNANGVRINEALEGITQYMVHWGLEVSAPGIDDDKGAGDLGGDCRGFRDTGHVVAVSADMLGGLDTISWEIPAGTVVPATAVYFVGHTVYGSIHNLAKCTQTPISNLVE